MQKHHRRGKNAAEIPDNAIMVKIGSERGIALVLVLVMISLLGVLGAFALSTSSTESHISGNYRSSQQSFYAADSGLAYGRTAPIIKQTMVGSVTAWPVGASGLFEDSNGTLRTDYAKVTVGGDVVGVKVRKVPSNGKIPPDSGYDAVMGVAMGVDYVVITAIGIDRNNSITHAESVTEAMVGWVY